MRALADRALGEWLAHIESVHSRMIDLSLDRPRRVLHCLRPITPSVIVSVAGTNGKGSTVSMLDAVYRAAGYRVGTYTSPHLTHFGERIRVDGVSSSDEVLCQAFHKIDQVRGAVPLTYFEFSTLAAIEIFSNAALDIWIMEVGMGGRLDAVNVLEPDLAIITSVDLDHQAWLGDTRDAIAREKAGILRFKGKAVVSDPAPPAALLSRLDELQCDLCLMNRDFRMENIATGHWVFLPAGATMAGPSIIEGFEVKTSSPVWAQNIAGSLAALWMLGDVIPVEPAHLETLQTFSLPGRQQRSEGSIVIWFDVAHNLQAATALAMELRAESIIGKTRAVFAMLQDKDITGTVAVMKDCIDTWYPAALEGPRALTVSDFRSALSGVCVTDQEYSASPREAYQMAIEASQPGDRVVVFGSFYLVGDILVSQLERTPG
ncbi:MAG TPA: bifunctional folylpolyglutamate synthase/dihydrofolate synthase [Gammaproteobacteria bacterium]|nr:bifunctional folylpolyglutamate synthase/dihydrofolate synthase [Gammaproteobacteria bacterium]